MRAPALSLPRRPATLVGLKSRDAAPTVPADDERPTIAPEGDEDVPIDSFAFEDAVTQRTRNPYRAEEPTERRDRPYYESDLPTMDVPLDPRLAFEPRSERSGVVMSAGGRFEATTPLATPAIPPEARRPEDVTRVDTPRMRIVPPSVAPMGPSAPERHAFAHAPTMMLTPSSGVHVYGSGAYPTPAASGIVPIHAHPVHAHPYGLAYPTPMPPSYPSSPAPAGSVSTMPPAPDTVRRRAAAKSRGGSRFAMAVCTVIVLGAAVVAVAESPVGDRPALAPAAKVVRHESRRGLAATKALVQTTWMRVRALRMPT